MTASDSMNSAPFETLKGLIKSGRIPHSFLIEGATPEERLRMAVYIAQAVVCTGESRPCGACSQCKTALSGSNPDITFLTSQGDKRFISVDRIRELRQEAFVMPHSAEKRVFIIEDALRLNEQGQNALLKILEEPPKTVIFILLAASRTELLPTVVSRCSVFILSGGDGADETLSEDAQAFVSLLFESREYDMLTLLRKYENDRTKALGLLSALGDECVKQLRTGELSQYRSKALSRIFDALDGYAASVRTNVNMTLLFSAMVCKFKSFIK